MIGVAEKGMHFSCTGKKEKHTRIKLGLYYAHRPNKTLTKPIKKEPICSQNKFRKSEGDKYMCFLNGALL